MWPWAWRPLIYNRKVHLKNGAVEFEKNGYLPGKQGLIKKDAINMHSGKCRIQYFLENDQNYGKKVWIFQLLLHLSWKFPNVISASLNFHSTFLAYDKII